MTTQRIWRRVEAPGTFRGHALVADLHGVRWYAWEQRDGSWGARRGDGAPIPFGTWTELRTTAERGPNPARADQGFDRVLQHQSQEAIARARQVLGALLRAAGPRSGGGIWVTVSPGHGRLAYARLLAAQFPCNVRILEAQ